MVAARLHQTIARALDNRTDYADARGEYDRAAVLFKQVDGELSQDVIVIQLQRVTLEARELSEGLASAGEVDPRTAKGTDRIEFLGCGRRAGLGSIRRRG